MSFIIIYVGIICGYILRFVKCIKRKRKKRTTSKKRLFCFPCWVIEVLVSLLKKFYLLLCKIVKGIVSTYKRLTQYISERYRGIKRKLKDWCKAKKAQLLANDYIYMFAKVVQIYSERENELRKVNITSFKEYCEKSGNKYIVFEEGKECPVCKPHFFEKLDQEIEYFKSPDIYIAELENVYIKGGSSLIMTKDCCLYDPLARDEEGRLDIKFSNVVGKIDDYYLIAEKRNVTCIDKGIFLLGFASYNYYHLTIEIMSRLAYIDAFEEYREFPLLVDEIMMKIPQYKDLVEKFNIYNHPIIMLDSDEMVKVNNIVYPSYNTWMPINVKSREMVYPRDFIIAQSALDNIRSYKRDLPVEKEKKIIISRKNTSNIRLKNGVEVVKLFEKYGFEVVHTEDLTYDEQVQLFHQAKCIVGTSGAALTNIVYCQENTDIICIIPEEYKFYMYSTIAYMLKLNPIFLDAVVIEKTAYTASDVFELDMSYCERFLNQYVN